MPVSARYIGIDFSGAAEQWRPTRSKPSVWIAELSDRPVPSVIALYPVQDLYPVKDYDGPDSPFNRLAAFLGQGDYRAAGLDAPFSVPDAFLPESGWRGLLTLNDSLPHPRRPFPAADDFLAALTQTPPAKHYRQTETSWRKKGLNVRSSLWWKPRGGAPFTTACLKLIAMATPKACWPWTTADSGMLVEAFPMAQLHHWGLDYQGYNGAAGHATRARIIAALAGRVDFGPHVAKVQASADALDAVLAGFAAIAASRGIAPPPSPYWPDGEGCIAIHP